MLIYIIYDNHNKKQSSKFYFEMHIQNINTFDSPAVNPCEYYMHNFSSKNICSNRSLSRVYVN